MAEKEKTEEKENVVWIELEKGKKKRERIVAGFDEWEDARRCAIWFAVVLCESGTRYAKSTVIKRNGEIINEYPLNETMGAWE